MIGSSIAIVVLLALCFFGVRIGIATLLVGVVGFAIERGIGPAMLMSGQRILDDPMNYNLSVIPLFVLIGVFIYRADISAELYQAAYRSLRNTKGGLAHATVIACAGFSAVYDRPLATVATMAKVAMPSMRNYRYKDSLSTGTVRDIRAHLEDVYGLQVSSDRIRRVTDAVLDKARECQSRAFDRMYPTVIFDALRVKIRNAPFRDHPPDDPAGK